MGRDGDRRGRKGERKGWEGKGGEGRGRKGTKGEWLFPPERKSCSYDLAITTGKKHEEPEDKNPHFLYIRLIRDLIGQSLVPSHSRLSEYDHLDPQAAADSGIRRRIFVRRQSTEKNSAR